LFFNIFVIHAKNKRTCTLINHGGIWILELNKFEANSMVDAKEKWLTFFKKGEDLDDDALPDWMQSKEMRQAMNTLRQFSEKEKQYHLYQARQEYLREKVTMEYERDLAEKKALQLLEELQRKDSALKEKDTALALAQAEIERLKKLLN
jgi:hypothetical protein